MTKLPKKMVQEALEQIVEWNRHLKPQFFDAKMKKMSGSPYYFFRGTNHLFWKYCANEPRLQEFSALGSDCWIQADLHAYNYGVYCNNQGELVYDLNDFDESCIANYQYDLWRMAASIVLIAKENEFADENEISEFVKAFANSYVSGLAQFQEKKQMEIAQVTKKNAYGKLDEVLEQVEKKESRKEMIEHWTKVQDERLMFDLSHNKLAPVTWEKMLEIKAAMPGYFETLNSFELFEDGYFEIIDVAQRISTGTGSLGTPRYYVLVKGGGEGKYEQRILDFKLQQKATLYHFLGDKFKKSYDEKFESEGERHMLAYMALNCYTDLHLGWISLSEGVFSVRERSPYKSYFPTKLLNSTTRFNKLAKQWGHILAVSHIRASDQFDVAGILALIENNLNRFTTLVAEIAFEYALYNDSVYKAFMNKLFLEE